MPLPILHPAPHNPPAWYILFLHWFLHTSIDQWDKFVQIIAIVVGGIAGYFRWFKGRIYRGRVESTLAATVLPQDTVIYLSVTATIKNIGLAKLDIDKRYTSLRLCSCNAYKDLEECITADWEYQGNFDIFEHHDWIESSETIQDQILIVLPNYDQKAFQVELNVFSGDSCWISRIIAVPEEAKKAKPPKKRIIL